MRRQLLTLSVLISGLVPLRLTGQDPSRAADSARRLDSLATALKIWDRPTPATRPRAVALWTQAAELYRRAGDRRSEGDMLTQAGRGHSNRDTSEAYLQTALRAAREVNDTVGEGRALLWLGVNRVRLGQNDSALTLARAAARIARRVGDRWGEGRAWAFYWVAHPYLRLARLDSAEAYYRQAVAVARETGARTPEAGSLGDIGNIQSQRGRFDSALVYYMAALNGFRAVGHRPFEASWLNNIGNVHLDLGRSDSALVYFRQSLTVARESGNRGLEQSLAMNIGLVFMGAAQPDSAAAYMRSSVELARALGDSGVFAFALGSLGEAQQALGQSDSALANLRASVALLRAAGVPQEAYILAALGKAHLAAGRRDSALAAFHDGLRVARRAEVSVVETDILRSIGELHARSGKGSLASAVAYYDSAAAVRAAITAHAGADQSHVSFAETGAELFDHWTLAELARAEDIGREQSALAALAVAERGRAQALLDLLRRSQNRSDSAAGAPGAGDPVQPPGADLVREGRGLAASVRASGVPALAYMATKDTLLTWLLLPTGEVTVERQAVARDSVARVVAAIRGYLGADEALGRSLRSIEPDDAAATREETARRTARSIAGSSAAMFGGSASVLLPPSLVSRLPRGGELVIVPHGPLGLVAFAALPLASEAGGEAAAHVLGAQFAIRYAPSLTALELVSAGATAVDRRRRGETPAGGALVVGNPAMPAVPVPRGGTIRLPALPAAGREGAWVARALGVTSLTGRAATERAVRDRMGTARIIHLATHGFAYSADAKVLDSFVALAPDSVRDGAGNGLLTVGEMIEDGPRLTAELVVLSACQTGLGNLKQAEGTVGLQRAFLAKGARTVLVSLWSVSDEATELLMRRFYTHWLDDADRPSKAEGLRRAQADVRQTKGFEHPRYWAAFQLVGAR